MPAFFRCSFLLGPLNSFCGTYGDHLAVCGARPAYEQPRRQFRHASAADGLSYGAA